MSNTNKSRRSLLVGLFAAISGGLFLRKAEAQPSERDDGPDCEVADNRQVSEEHFVYNSSGQLIEITVVYGD